MANSPGDIATAAHFNAVGSKINKVFGDIYATAAVTDANRIDTHKYGWGSGNVVVAVADDITATQLQGLVAKTNISTNHTDLVDSIIVFTIPTNRTDIGLGTLIRAEDLNKIDDKFAPILLNNKHLTIDPTNASAIPITPSGGSYSRTTGWQTKLVGEHKWTWGSYNKARYFFNAGGQVRISLTMSGGSTAGYYNWADVINEMGVLNFDWDTVTQSTATTLGTSEAKGFYDLTDKYGDGSDGAATNEGLLFQSSGVTLGRQIGSYGYGYGYGYGGGQAHGYITGKGIYPNFAERAIFGGTYSNTIYVSSYSIYSSYQQLKFRMYGKYVDNGASVQLKIVLDDTAHANIIDGSITPALSILMPDTITSGATSLDVTPNPTCSVINTFTSADDS
jgi:hypothetical protein